MLPAAWMAFGAAELMFLRGPWRAAQGTFTPLNLAGSRHSDCTLGL
jgi:hypothetical protein